MLHGTLAYWHISTLKFNFGTLTREEEMDKRKEPDFNYVFHRIVLKKQQQSNTLHRLVCYNGETSLASFKNNGCSGPLVAMT
mgnify:CR=1 FL=1